MRGKPTRSEPVELDLDRYELRRGGRRVALERIPMELLILLVQRKGALVTRDEIIEKLWGKNPYLDPETNVNTAIGKIRRALRDDSDEPCFVETVVGKGYRFVAPVRAAGSQASSSAGGEAEIVLISSRAADVPRLSGHMLNHAPPAVQGATVLAPRAAVLPMPQPRSASVERAAPQAVPEARRRTAFARIWPAVLAVAILVAMGIAYESSRLRPIPGPQDFIQITHDNRKKAFQIGNIPAPIVSDGSRLYFTMPAAGGKLEVGEVAAAGGESGVLSSPLESARPLAVLPDGSGVLLASPAELDAPLWIQPVPNGSPHRLADAVAGSASWSPDGERLAYAHLNTLFVASRDGANPKLLVSLPISSGQDVYWPRWSPDGQCLRFSIHDPKTSSSSIWQVAADGSRLQALLPGWNQPAGECCGSWTLDGNDYVFVAKRHERENIWVLPEKAGIFRRHPQPLQLTAGPLNYSAPLPSSDGKTIFIAGEENRGELVRYDSNARDFVPYLSGISASGADFSRNGEWVTYVSYPDQTLWRMRTDGSDPRQLTVPPLQIFLPRWSPDGKEIVFYARMPGLSNDIYIIPAEGGTPEKLMGGIHNDLDPGWSPDGASLIFERSPWKERGAGRDTAIHFLDLKTRQISTLQGSAGLVSPRWSPDGRWVAAMPADSGGLMLFSFATRQWTELIRLHIGYPNWSPDGEYIYFDRFDNPPGIARLGISDRKVEPVVNIAGNDRLWSLDTWTAPAPDGSPLLLRDVSLQEIYALKWTAR